MARQGTSGTRTAEVHRRLRNDILGGRLVPGARLKFPDLCEQYGVSVGAAREALTRLTSEGLVKTQPHQGYMVTPLSYEDLADLTRARVEIESLVLRLSVLEGDVQWESRAVAAHHVLERALFLSPDDPAHPTDEWAAAHAAFHLALLDGCTNRRLLDTARAYREEAELYRQWSVSFGQEPHRDLVAEHRALLEAAVGRQPDLAARLLREHIAHTAQLLISVVGDGPVARARG
ncbi:GntR family transcriptional regulator [Streptomyces violaceusniger]|uniref:Transcriptional regulator, GntR family n=1 Tax=Streptomyces violaceusniger (strain Tu 4113) TaxID=653045 RepID=G2P504_STRV4|nr:GntR family transcriptional regulator [Streptomyces violaceusniger]AEM84181.1 transcriptional regulator, GntR family [Streptomyces violaceusniger Tu 4113]